MLRLKLHLDKAGLVLKCKSNLFEKRGYILHIHDLVELGVAFYLIPPSHASIPHKSEWHDGQRCLVYGEVY